MTKTLPIRKEVKKEDQWNLEDFYKSDDDWHKEFSELNNMVKDVIKYKETLSETAENLAKCLKKADELVRVLEKVFVYSHLKYDQDTSNTFYAGRHDQSKTLCSQILGEISFIRPEIFMMPDDKMKNFMNQECLKPYTFFLEDMLRLKPHVLSTEEEKILTQADNVFKSPYKIFSSMDNADMKFPTVIDENGNEIAITHGKYPAFLRSKNRELRKDAFEKYQSTYKNWKNTFGSLLASHVNSTTFKAKTRKYKSAIEEYLYADNVTIEIYDNLLNTVHDNLPALHKYMDLRKKVLGLDELHLYDVYVPLIENYDEKFTFEKAKNLIINALQPLGKDYIENMKKGIENGWIDKYENEGKRNGAYSSGCYDSYPYILLNFNGKINDMFTFAHELGHSMHTYYSVKYQPHIYAEYKIFVAEVASLTNEALLTDYLLKNATSKEEKIYIINNELEKIRGTLYRQAMFAEFEKLIFQEIELGKPLTEEELSNIYRDLNIKWFGKNVVIDELINYEWARIPHFYYNFYVYKYCIGISCANTIAEKIINAENGAVEKYIENLLKAGGSNYPVELLKLAGVDISTPEPINKTLKYFSKLVDKLDSLIFD